MEEMFPTWRIKLHSIQIVIKPERSVPGVCVCVCVCRECGNGPEFIRNFRNLRADGAVNAVKAGGGRNKGGGEGQGGG